MRTLRHGVLVSAAYTFLVAALIFFPVAWISQGAFWLLYPAMRVAAALFPSMIDFDSGANNFIAALVLAVPINFAICTGVLYLIFGRIRVRRAAAVN
jgi:hypothetical protein